MRKTGGVVENLAHGHQSDKPNQHFKHAENDMKKEGEYGGKDRSSSLQASNAKDRCFRSSDKPLFRFGVIADVQYADIKNASNFDHTEYRFYRGALSNLKKAIDYWNEHEPEILFIAQMGDLIDGQNSGKYGEGLKMKEPHTDEAIGKVLAEFERSKCLSVHHTVGNHELMNFDRGTLLKLLFSHRKDVGLDKLYYSFRPIKSWRFVLIDSFELSVERHDKDSAAYHEAKRLIDNNNPNIARGRNWFKDISKDRQRFVPYNGGLGKEQIKWINNELKEATIEGERVVILSHQPLTPEAASCQTVLWNYPEVLSLIEKFECVCMVIAGHYHNGGYVKDKNGCHHVTVKACLTCEEGAYGTLDVYDDRIVLRGRGAIPKEEVYHLRVVI
mmetsp:Transcript_34278/g.55610  ORF Transcript_34278/g.55610 Transcript_34278/m.55610 type:complete len:387 (+) Transcript_34278:144-1304(+)